MYLLSYIVLLAEIFTAKREIPIVARQLKRKKKGNEATVHAEVKRQFQVPSYQLIPEAEFDRVKQLLGGWYRRLAGPGAPIPSIFDNPSQKRLL